jgi:VanZ family protein
MKLVHHAYPRSRTRRSALLPALMLAFSVAVLVVLAYFPFDWDPPHSVRNDVTRTSEGSLRFGERNFARSSGSPEWLVAAQTAGHIAIDLEARPRFPQHNSSASIMMLANDYWHTSFAIGQDGTNLVLWLRRPGSNYNGDPPFTMPEIFRPNHWTQVHVEIMGTRLTVVVNGKVMLLERLRPSSLSTWYSALGDEVHGGDGWNGEVRRAKITTVGYTIDYVRSEALLVPQSYFYFPDHITPFPPPSAGEWFILLLHFLSFIIVGLLVVWTRQPAFGVPSATITAFGFAVALSLGKFFFHGRHTSIADLVTQLLGALIGAMLAQWWLRGTKQSRSVSRDDPDSLPARAT